MKLLKEPCPYLELFKTEQLAAETIVREYEKDTAGVKL